MLNYSILLHMLKLYYICRLS